MGPRGGELPRVKVVHGNPVGDPRRFPFDLTGSADHRDAQIRHAISQLLHWAKSCGVTAIGMENLDFADEKTREKHGGKKRFRQLISGIPTGRLRARLVSMAADRGLVIVAVDPAYTSVWGARHWQKPLATPRRTTTRHDAASIAIGRRALGHPTAARGDHQRAAVLLGAVRALSRATGVRARYLYDGHHARCEEEVIKALGPAGYEKALAQGDRYDTPARAIALALDDPTTGRGADDAPRGGIAGAGARPAAEHLLTRREREVAVLVAKGMTNRQVAGALGLSTRTADSHVASILAKLGFVCRAQVAAWWTENNLGPHRGTPGSTTAPVRGA